MACHQMSTRTRQAMNALSWVVTHHAVAVFAAMAVAAVALTLWLGRDLTFFMDECDFLNTRDPTDPMSLLAPHNEHWMTIPLIAYSGIVAVFGIASYLPFLAFLSLVHVFTAAGLLALLRPARYALGASVLLLFLGSGYENQFWAFQIGFVGATGLGVWALVATQRGRPALAACLLTAGAATQLIGLAFIPAAAVMSVRRRDVLWLALPILTFLAWYLAFGRQAVGIHRDPFTMEGIALVPGFVAGSIHSTVARISGFGPTLTLILLAGLGVAAAVAAWRGWRPSRLVVAGAVGLVVLFGIIGLGRAHIPGYAPRYVTTAAPFVFAVFAPLFAIRGRAAVTVAAIVFAVALTSNVLAMRDGSAQMAYLETTNLRCEPAR
jgi:hypothetical protein